MVSPARRLAPYALVLWSACASNPPPPRPPPPVPSLRPPTQAAPTRAERRAWRSQGRAAYRRKDWLTCATLLERAGNPYEAACCYAQAGRPDPAFALLAQAIDDGWRDGTLDAESELAPLHSDPRWQIERAHLAARDTERRKTLNAELLQLFHDDQADRDTSVYDKIDWNRVRPRDQERRRRVDAIVAAGGARAADDYYHAAMVYQHGETPDDIQRAHDLALKAVELDPRHDDARWLAAASEDRKLMYEHKPQKWGTQYKRIDGVWIVWEVDPSITDDQRDEWNVQPLADARAHAAELNAPHDRK